MPWRVFFWTTLVLVAAAVFGLWSSLRSYHVFAHEELAAVVWCEAGPEGSGHDFLLEVTPVSKGTPGRTEQFLMKGDQWMIGGAILKWRPWLAYLGARSCHKLTRLNSRYSSIEAERSEPRTVYDLNGGSGFLWCWAYRTGIRLPFVDAVYGNAVYLPARPRAQWSVYVTHSGYFVRPLESSS